MITRTWDASALAATSATIHRSRLHLSLSSSLSPRMTLNLGHTPEEVCPGRKNVTVDLKDQHCQMTTGPVSTREAPVQAHQTRISGLNAPPFSTSSLSVFTIFDLCSSWILEARGFSKMMKQWWTLLLAGVNPAVYSDWIRITMNLMPTFVEFYVLCTCCLTLSPVLCFILIFLQDASERDTRLEDYISDTKRRSRLTMRGWTSSSRDVRNTADQSPIRLWNIGNSQLRGPFPSTECKN